MTCRKNFLIAKLFFKKFSKITCILPFYVLQYKHNKTKNKIHRKVKGDYYDEC